MHEVDYVYPPPTFTTCFYSWPSTGPEENRDPNKYPRVFRLNPGGANKTPRSTCRAIAPTVSRWLIAKTRGLGTAHLDMAGVYLHKEDPQSCDGACRRGCARGPAKNGPRDAAK